MLVGREWDKTRVVKLRETFRSSGRRESDLHRDVEEAYRIEKQWLTQVPSNVCLTSAYYLDIMVTVLQTYFIED